MPGLTDSRSGPGDGERAGEERIKSVSQSDKHVHPLRAPGLAGTLVASPFSPRANSQSTGQSTLSS